MSPMLKNGDFVIIRRKFILNKKTNIGDVVLFSNPITNELYIKQCSGIYKNSIFVTGTNLPASTDSRHFGRITEENIKGWLWKKL